MENTDLGLTLLRLLGPSEPELGCDECFAELDRYVELEVAGATPSSSYPDCTHTSLGCPGLRRGAREPARAARAGLHARTDTRDEAIMSQTRYLIVGGGMTGDAAAKSIREHDPDGSIRLVGAEQHAPYARPPLSKKLWLGGDEEKIWRHTAEAGSRPATRPPHRRARPRRAGGDRRRRRGARVGPAPARDRRSAAHARPAPRTSSTSGRSTTTTTCVRRPARARGSWSSAAASSAPRSRPR